VSGVRTPLTEQGREEIRARIPEVRGTTQHALSLVKGMLDQFTEEIETFGNFPSLYLGLVAGDGTWEHYGGRLRFMDAEGKVVADGLDPQRYQDFIGEAVHPWSYLKSPYYKPLGFPDGMYRVGPLARLNLCERMGTPLADQELREYRDRLGRPVNGSFHFHYARLIEVLACIERIERMLDDPDLLSGRHRAQGGINRLEGVGVSEAPRGTLFHHYQVDENGLMKKVNLIIATGQNNLAMNRTVKQIAQHFIKGPQILQGVLNRVEAGIRAFDPCLSCSTHAVGQMALHIQLLGPDGRVLDEVRRR
jgi:NAD-reducing hydrogenase large subunit